MSYHPQFTVNDNIECLANLCQCYDYLDEYQDPNTKTALEHIEHQLASLSDFAFRSLLFPRIVNYIKTYSHHTAHTYVYIEYRIVEIDANTEYPSVTFIECYDYEEEPKTNEQFKITVMKHDASVDGNTVPVKLEVFRVDDALTLNSCKTHSMTKHDDITKWLAENI
jgi:hypothetical protein